VNDPKWLRIAELERLSGMPRATIHFYLREGLLHQPMKTGKTMAYYNTTHLHKLTYIQKSRERGTPLVAIRGELAAIDPAGFDTPVWSGSGPARCGTPAGGKRLPNRAHGRKTRERILQAGSDRFRSSGYRNTRVSDITRELSIGKGTFYFYFSDKKELFLECVPRIFEDLFSGGWERIRQVRDPQERLALRARQVFPVLDEFCTILRLCKEAMDDPHPKLKRLGEETYLSIRKPLEQDIERGIRQGTFQDVDPVVASTFLVGIIEGLHSLQAVDRQPPSSRVWDQALRLILTGMKGPSDARKTEG
jgi:AcrR family transcriptional regulator